MIDLVIESYPVPSPRITPFPFSWDFTARFLASLAGPSPVGEILMGRNSTAVVN